MAFYPEDFWNREDFFEGSEHLRDTASWIGLDHIGERIVDRTLDIRFIDPIIGRREAGSHEHLPKVGIEHRHMRDIFRIVDIRISLGFGDDLERFFE